MRAEKLITLRESLGLSMQWLADVAEVDLSTVGLWESGRLPAPEYIGRMLSGLDSATWNQADESADRIVRFVTEHGPWPKDIVLLKFRTDADLWEFYPNTKPIPASACSVMVSRVRRRLWESGLHSVVVYMDPADYRQWLDGRPDDSALQSQWADEQWVHDLRA